MKELDRRVSIAVKSFWHTRDSQKLKQTKSGKKDQGNRGAATGGGQLDGFALLISELLIESGVPEECIFLKKKITFLSIYIKSINKKSFSGKLFQNQTKLFPDHGTGISTIECNMFSLPRLDVLDHLPNHRGS